MAKKHPANNKRERQQQQQLRRQHEHQHWDKPDPPVGKRNKENSILPQKEKYFKQLMTSKPFSRA